MSAADGRGFPPVAPVLRGAQVVLRPPSDRDAADVRALGRDPEIYRCFGEQVDAWRELSPAEAGEFLAALRPSADAVPWAIETTGTFVGTARLHSLDRQAKTAAYAVAILSPRLLGRGLGTETTRLVLDFVHLGLGPDGHTASLFPHSPALAVEDRLVVVNEGQGTGKRLTLTYPVLNAARRVLFIVTGAAKAGMVAEVLEGLRAPDAIPAQAVSPVHGSLTWLLDEAAAGELSGAARS